MADTPISSTTGTTPVGTVAGMYTTAVGTIAGMYTKPHLTGHLLVEPGADGSSHAGVGRLRVEHGIAIGPAYLHILLAEIRERPGVVDPPRIICCCYGKALRLHCVCSRPPD